MSIRSARTTDQHPEPTDHLYNAGLGRTFLRSRGAQIGRVMDAIIGPEKGSWELSRAACHRHCRPPGR